MCLNTCSFRESQPRRPLSNRPRQRAEINVLRVRKNRLAGVNLQGGFIRLKVFI
jgi:hypothetical protein